MMVSWWWMEWACRRLWAQYPPNVEFHVEHSADPLEVALALRPVHWGRFVAYSIWLQGQRVIVYKRLLQEDPRFIPGVYELLGRWLLGVLCPQEEEEQTSGCLRRSYCCRCSGWGAPLCTCSKVKGTFSPRDLTERVGLHFASSASSSFCHGSRDGAQHRSTMGGRFGGDATVLA